MMTPEERYYHDPMFHRLVDMMHNEIINARYTPSELREAAMLAAIHYESHTIRHNLFMKQEGRDE